MRTCWRNICAFTTVYVHKNVGEILDEKAACHQHTVERHQKTVSGESLTYGKREGENKFLL
jgi:hypothetical protein